MRLYIKFSNWNFNCATLVLTHNLLLYWWFAFAVMARGHVGGTTQRNMLLIPLLDPAGVGFWHCPPHPERLIANQGLLAYFACFVFGFSKLLHVACKSSHIHKVKTWILFIDSINHEFPLSPVPETKEANVIGHFMFLEPPLSFIASTKNLSEERLHLKSENNIRKLEWYWQDVKLKS